MGEIVGITIGCLLFVALVVVVIVVAIKIIKKKNGHGLESQSMRLIR